MTRSSLLFVLLSACGTPASAQDAALDAFEASAAEASVSDVTFEAAVCPDRDLDGHRDRACGGDDCNDIDPNVFPRAATRCTFVDGNCDGRPDWQASRSTLDEWCARNAPNSDVLAAGPWCATPLITSGPYPVSNDALCVACRADSASPRGFFCACWRAAGMSWNCDAPEPNIRDR